MGLTAARIGRAGADADVTKNGTMKPMSRANRSAAGRLASLVAYLIRLLGKLLFFTPEISPVLAGFLRATYP